ncbi:MAG: sugar ABC transporter permease [Lachnospiraceae bacterium]|nr:sugar ABC transporter permease [Lachnospiraceae bacterium]MCI9682876.1 sugar ABC transporter permease [Lachnospiraceae bacterium]
MRATKKRQKIFGSKNAWIWFLLPSGIGVLIFVCLPFLDVVRRSFLTVVTQEWVGIHNYQLIFNNQAFLLAVKNTLRFTVICLPILIGLGLFLAVQLSRLRKIQFLKSCFLFPMAMPAAAIVLVWRMVFSKQGFLNLLLDSLRLVPESGPVDYMSTEAAFWVLVFSYVWKNLGYTIVLWLAGIFSIPADILDAARVDGANERQCFWRVIFPNLKGTLYTITVLSFLNSFKVFREAYLVAGSYPHESMYLLQHLFNNWFVNLELDKMAAAAVCVGVVLFLFILLLQKFWDKAV